MDPNKSSELIDKAGGAESFARLLGIDKTPGFRQRISNWKRRGIPARVVLDNLKSLQALEEKEVA